MSQPASIAKVVLFVWSCGCEGSFEGCSVLSTLRFRSGLEGETFCCVHSGAENNKREKYGIRGWSCQRDYGDRRGGRSIGSDVRGINGSLDGSRHYDVWMYGCNNVEFSYVPKKKNKKEKNCCAGPLIAKSGKAVTPTFVCRFCLFVPDLILIPADNRLVLCFLWPWVCTERFVLLGATWNKEHIHQQITDRASDLLWYRWGRNGYLVQISRWRGQGEDPSNISLLHIFCGLVNRWTDGWIDELDS